MAARAGLRRARAAAVAATLMVALAACGRDGEDAAGTAATAGGPPATDGSRAAVAEPELRDELLEMQAQDLEERTSASADEWRDEERTARLAEILDEYGWPGHDLVGEDGSTAAWTIAQHSDLDREVQERALQLLRAAVEQGQASPGDLAYLEDRVATNAGRPQVYGTQIRCVDGEAQVRDLADPATIDERRADAGLQPLDDYLAEMRPACQEEAAGAAGATAAGPAG